MKRASILAARGHILTAEMRARPRRKISRVRNPSPDGNISQEMEQLLYILSMNDRQRAEEIAYQATYLLTDGLRRRYGAIADKLEDDNDVEAAIWAVHNEDPTWLKRWADDAEIELMRDEPDEAPTFLFFGKPTVVRNAWLVHFTDHAEAIAFRGFTKGVDDPMRLGLTTRISDDRKARPGYVFSFLPQGVQRYAFTRGRPKYGREAVVFRADAIVAHHDSDGEDQAISWGPEAKDITAVRIDERTPCVILDDEDEDACFDDFPTLVAWLDARLAAKQQNPARRRR